MDRLGIGDLGCADDAGNVQVTVRALGRADTDALVGKPDVESVSIGGRMKATVLMPISLHARMMRRAISPRLAINIFLNTKHLL